MVSKQHGLMMAVCLMSLLFQTGSVRAGTPAKIKDVLDRKTVKGFLLHVAKSPASVKRYSASDKPEDHCWITFKFIAMPLTAYQLTGDTKWLDMFVSSFASLQKRLVKGTDGFLGWYGKALGNFHPRDKPDLKVDVIITSFECVDLLCQFIETIDADPVLKARYADSRSSYVDLMSKHLVRKWIVRKNYVDLGKQGAIFRTHVQLRDVKAHLTQPHNKHSIIIRGLTGLYRVTGEDEYMRMAVKLGIRFKRCLALRSGSYSWNYWDPAGGWDVDPADKGKWKHWVNVEHKGGYYSSSLMQAVVLYQHGLVFEQRDLDRFLKTQLSVCWNGDTAKPQWSRTDGTRNAKYMKGAYMCAYLAPYSQSIESFCYSGAAQAGRLKQAGHGWQGGPMARGWIHGKIVYLPRARANPQFQLEAGRRFLGKAENRDLLKELAFDVSGKGYSAPKVPAEMKKMPVAE